VCELTHVVVAFVPWPLYYLAVSALTVARATVGTEHGRPRVVGLSVMS